MKRALLAFVHGVVSIVALLRGLLRRGRAVLVFTHGKDRDADGLDQQLGPLITAWEHSETRLVEVCLLPLPWLRPLFQRRPLVSAALVFGPARVLSWFGRATLLTWRVRLASLVLWAWQPVALVLIDESGSGQPFVRAARRRGIPTLGVQHGDFRPHVTPYGASEGQTFDRVPVDRFALWSPWFRERLFAISPIYDAANTAVTGRLRWFAARRDAVGRGVLVLLEADPIRAAFLAPYLDVLMSAKRLDVVQRAHPSVAPHGGQPSLHADLEKVRIVVGIGSSALLESLHSSRAVLLPMTPLGDPLGLLSEALAQPARSPGELLQKCWDLLDSEWPPAWVVRARDRVWGGTPEDPIAAINVALRAAKWSPEIGPE